MQGTVWLRYLLGQGHAIRQAAESRATLWTGMILVLLTAFARSYDQTWIGEKPLHWLFGPLVFSFFSGTWLYIVAYGTFARQAMADADGVKPPFWSGWRVFMGLFWLTAPVAWLYAIPVERFLEPVAAAKANLTLLAVVSLWRVLLITRVIQCLTRAPFLAVLTWVWFAAAVEVLIVVFFGGAFARSIMASMGGMRNSPAEDILLNGLGNAFVGALFTAPVALVLGIPLCLRVSAERFGIAGPGRVPWKSLTVVAIFWMGVSIVPQQELQRTAVVEKLLSEDKPRAALDYLSAHTREQFAPARTLPPNPYEYEIFTQLPDCFGVVQPSDKAWVREFLMERLDAMTAHLEPRWGSMEDLSREEQVDRMQRGIGNHADEAGDWIKLLSGLERIPEGAAWFARNDILLEALKSADYDALIRHVNNAGTNESANAQWLEVSNRVEKIRQNDSRSNASPNLPVDE